MPEVKDQLPPWTMSADLDQYFDLDGNVEDDETDEGMEIISILKSTAYDIQQQHDANRSAIAPKKACND